MFSFRLLTADDALFWSFVEIGRRNSGAVEPARDLVTRVLGGGPARVVRFVDAVGVVFLVALGLLVLDEDATVALVVVDVDVVLVEVVFFTAADLGAVAVEDFGAPRVRVVGAILKFRLVSKGPKRQERGRIV